MNPRTAKLGGIGGGAMLALILQQLWQENTHLRDQLTAVRDRVIVLEVTTEYIHGKLPEAQAVAKERIRAERQEVK